MVAREHDVQRAVARHAGARPLTEQPAVVGLLGVATALQLCWWGATIAGFVTTTKS